jgi:Mg-chelatase subunit ChlD
MELTKRNADTVIEEKTKKDPHRIRNSEKREQLLTDYVEGLLPSGVSTQVDLRVSPQVRKAFVVPTNEDELFHSEQSDLSRQQCRNIVDSTSADYLIFITGQPANLDNTCLDNQLTADIAQQYGLALHETLHILKTSVNKTNKLIKTQIDDEFESLLQKLHNTIEDGAIENELKTGDEFSGRANARITLVRDLQALTPEDLYERNGLNPVKFTFNQALDKVFYSTFIYGTGVKDALLDKTDTRIQFETSEAEDVITNIHPAIKKARDDIFGIRSDIEKYQINREASIKRTQRLIDLWLNDIKPELTRSQLEEQSDENPQNQDQDEQAGGSSTQQDQPQTQQQGESRDQQQGGGQDQPQDTQEEQQQPENVEEGEPGETPDDPGEIETESDETGSGESEMVVDIDPSEMDTNDLQELDNRPDIGEDDEISDKNAEEIIDQNPSEQPQGTNSDRSEDHPEKDSTADGQNPESSINSDPGESPGGDESEADDSAEADSEVDSENHDGAGSSNGGEDGEESEEPTSNEADSQSTGPETSDEASADEEGEEGGANGDAGGSTGAPNEEGDEPTPPTTTNQDQDTANSPEQASDNSANENSPSQNGQSSLLDFDPSDGSGEKDSEANNSENTSGNPSETTSTSQSEETGQEGGDVDPNDTTDSDNETETHEGAHDQESTSEDQAVDPSDLSTQETGDKNSPTAPETPDNPSASSEDLQATQSDTHPPMQDVADENQKESEGPTPPAGNEETPAHDADDISENDFRPERETAERQADDQTVNEDSLRRDIDPLISGGNEAGEETLHGIDILPDPDGDVDADWDAIKDDAKKVSRRLANQLENSRKSSTRRDLSAGTSVNTQTAYRLNQGDPRTFKRERKGEKKKYTIIIVLDRSGSMGKQRTHRRSRQSSDTPAKIETAVQAVTRFAAACEELDIKVGVVDFINGKCRYVKTPSIDTKKSLDRLLTTEVGGGTPLDDALDLAGDIAEKQREKSLIISITDDLAPDVDDVIDVLNETRTPVCSLTIATDENKNNPPEKAEKLRQGYTQSRYVFDEGKLNQRLDEFASLVGFF